MKIPLFVVIGIFTLGFVNESLFANSLKGSPLLIPGVEEYELIVKFTPSAGPDINESGSLKFHNATHPEALKKIGRWAPQFKRVVTYSPSELKSIRQGGIPPKNRKKFNKLDFAGLMKVKVPGAGKWDLLEFAKELETFDFVEYSFLQPVDGFSTPGDIPPTTPDLSDFQDWYGPHPGVDCEYANALGATGQGVSVFDIEFSWLGFVHEDLVDQDVGLGMAKEYDYVEEHGTAVAGIVVGGHNGYGIKGCAPDAKFRGYPSRNSNLDAATVAYGDAIAGNLVLWEVQTTGPNGEYAPIDYNVAIWDLVKTASDAGIITILAASNGGEDLDTPAYADYRARGDNGKIMIGAGTPNAGHYPLDFSTIGENDLHVQAWGRKVVTSGYGGFEKFGDDSRQAYSNSFAGTSSASAIVVGAAAAIQSYAQQKLNKTLTPLEMRELLITTGVPQAGGGYIGPNINTRGAIERLNQGLLFNWHATQIIRDGNSNGLMDPGESVELKVRGKNLQSQSMSNAVLIVKAFGEQASYVTVLNDSLVLDNIPAQSEAMASVYLSLDSDLPVDSKVYLLYTLYSGADSVTFTEQFKVSPEHSFKMSEGDFNSCTGLFYDSGGKDGDYGGNSDYRLIIHPAVPGAKVALTFNEFALEADASCGFDYLKIYSGESYSNGLIDTFCGTSLPDKVVSTDATGSLALVFHSDGGAEAKGWEIEVSCEGITSTKPQVVPQASNIQITANNQGPFFQLAFRLAIGHPSDLAIKVYDISGSLLAKGNIPSGKLKQHLDLGGSPQGLVFVSVEGLGVSHQQKLILRQ